MSLYPVAKPASSRQSIMVSAFVDEGAVKKSKASAKPEKKVKKEVDEGKIKRAPSPFNLFYRTAFPPLRTQSPTEKISTFMAPIAAQWNALSDEGKAPFIEESNKLKAAVASKR